MGYEKNGARFGGGYPVLKRIIDVVLSLLLVFFLALPMVVIAFAILFTSRGGAIFRQVRIGKDSRNFVCWKFRTMYISTPRELSSRELSSLENCEKFITPVGRFLRRTSLDELPQLFNVIKGDMSLIGPRPLIGSETEAHRMRQEQNVYSVRPGITGLAQINGRDRLCDSEKARLDTLYVQSLSFSSDVRIFFKTILRVARREDIF